MSFGFGIGDILAVTQLAKDIRKSFIGAPPQFASISQELGLDVDMPAHLSMLILEQSQKPLNCPRRHRDSL